LSAILAIAVGPLALRASAAALPEKVGFNAHVRPILSNACFFCHGPDEKHREAKLRLDLRSGAIKDLDGTRAIVPGHPDQSEMLVRLRSHDSDETMPPPKSKKPRVTPEEIALIEKWIAQGAEYEDHWAFVPLSHAPPPTIDNDQWPQPGNGSPAPKLNPIDQFTLARLAPLGLKPSMEADRATLLRRVTLDLIGLAPTPEEVRAFIEDSQPDAYARVVERLLASPHYGERWGRHWLDQARYADSNGYAIDGERAMWPYRDWVIKAFNDDMPFNQFTVEQLAGDLLPNPTKNQLIASAFHRNTLINEEGGTDAEQFRVEAVIDRTNTTGTVWLGLTVGCAQCHSHKFDPISHREYYELFAFFDQCSDKNAKGRTIEVARDEVFQSRSAIPIPSLVAPAKPAHTQTQWEQSELAKLKAAQSAPAQWSPAAYLEYDTSTGAGFRLLPDNSLLADGRAGANDSYRILLKAPAKPVGAIKLRVLTDDSLPHQGPGLAANGEFVLTDFQIFVDGVSQGIARASADLAQAEHPARGAIDRDPSSGWSSQIGSDPTKTDHAAHEIVFTLLTPIPGTTKPIELHLKHDFSQTHLIGRFALEFSETAPALNAHDPVALALQVEPGTRTPEQRKLLKDSYNEADPVKRALKARLESGNSAEQMIMGDLEKPRQTFLHLRGDYLRPDEKTGPLQPGVIKAVRPLLETAGSSGSPTPGPRTRMDLARWLVDARNPLTPRVTVNRIWMRFFGRGIVETDDDFGSQGALPTNPELLDWLANEFIERGWSLKAMHRLIVDSATYRQSSKARPDAMRIDPRNLYLARQERVRVEGEIVRDAALSASGLLSGAIGGPGVYPPQPPGVYTFTQRGHKWPESQGADRFRRALYTTFYRSAPYPLFTCFDSPDFQQVCTRRSRSDTPLQSLTLANDLAFLEIAQGLALRVIREIPSTVPETLSARLKRAWLLCLGRDPSDRELAILKGYYSQQESCFRDDPAGAKLLQPNPKTFPRTGLAPIDEAPVPTRAPDAEPPESLAAMICAARAIMNSDAFITRE